MRVTESIPQDPLIGTIVNGWLLTERINRGKSAVVYVGSKDGQTCAVKIFDTSLVERFGKDIQLKRIGRELTLIGKHHPNLVTIHDGGECKLTGHLFIVMDRLVCDNLADQITQIDRSAIGSIISQIAGAAEFLESLGLAHRDIKPENIAYDPKHQKAVLLDFGVIRPVALSDGTDTALLKRFVGTLRYASPEFLERREADTSAGWRAVTFYQLGAVLHDLIMRRRLFDNYEEPFVLLADAIRRDSPKVSATDVPPRLSKLAMDCLVKNPEFRLQLVTWDDFRDNQVERDPAATARSHLAKLAVRHQSDPPAILPPPVDRQVVLKQLAADLDLQVRRCAQSSQLPPAEFNYNVDTTRMSVSYRLSFSQAPSLGLKSGTNIDFTLEVISPEEAIVKLYATYAAAEPGAMPSEAEEIYAGVYQQIAFEGCIDATIPRAIASANP